MMAPRCIRILMSLDISIKPSASIAAGHTIDVVHRLNLYEVIFALHSLAFIILMHIIIVILIHTHINIYYNVASFTRARRFYFILFFFCLVFLHKARASAHFTPSILFHCHSCVWTMHLNIIHM